MFFLHALLLFFLLGTTSSSMAAVLPRNAAPGYSNLRIRSSLPSVHSTAALEGYWSPDIVISNHLADFIHINRKGEVDYVFSRVKPGVEGITEETVKANHRPPFGFGTYLRVLETRFNEELKGVGGYPAFTQPQGQYPDLLEFESPAFGVIKIRFHESGGEWFDGFKYKVSGNLKVKTIAQVD
ncbi:hypothetical protein AX14_002058 [Amanita brunnescens Koide BX004]|nr:hypothetical protein AX14_002058 [Amanita brunnescens Koide BX004]